jgi:lysophospholipid acyltransferase (LPLAT)-like uncharacterized protein
VGLVGPPLLATLARTWRWRVNGGEHLALVGQTHRPPILAFWHGRILPAIPFFRDRAIVVMASENFDGEWVARIIARFGYSTARGSTSRGGARALVQLKRAIAQGRPVAFTVDGPRGPVHRVQPGCIWLARATGSPILPFHIEAGSAWTLRSWDATQIPKPFTTLTVCLGEPLAVPGGGDAGDIEYHRRALEQALTDLVERAVRLTRPER